MRIRLGQMIITGIFSLIFIFTTITTIVFATPIKKGEDVAGNSCSRDNGPGKQRTFGKCEKVCKGKEVTKDPAGVYGGQYTCSAVELFPGHEKLPLPIKPVEEPFLPSDETLWSINAMACIPNGSTIENNQYSSSAGHVRFNETKKGNIYLICPITDGALHGRDADQIILTYKDTSGRNNDGGKVRANLRKVDINSGHVSDAGLSVNGEGCEAADFTACIDGLDQPGHTFDFNKYYYYVQITMFRNSTQFDVQAAGVKLTTSN